MGNDDMKFNKKKYELDNNIAEMYIEFEKERMALSNQIIQLQETLSEKDRKFIEHDNFMKKELDIAISNLDLFEKKLKDEEVKNYNISCKLNEANNIIERIDICRHVGQTVSIMLRAIPWPAWLFVSKSRLQRKIIVASGIVDPEWYLRNHEDVRAAGIDPIKHYVEFGANEGRTPSEKYLNLIYR